MKAGTTVPGKVNKTLRCCLKLKVISKLLTRPASHNTICVFVFPGKMAAEDGQDYPTEIAEQLTDFESSVTSVNTMLQKMLSVPRNDQLLKVRHHNGV